MTKDGLRKPNYWGSITQAATCRVGNYKGEEVHAPFSSLLPMVHPNDLVLGGWDISNLNLADAMERAKVRCGRARHSSIPLDGCRPGVRLCRTTSAGLGDHPLSLIEGLCLASIYIYTRVNPLPPICVYRLGNPSPAASHDMC